MNLSIRFLICAIWTLCFYSASLLAADDQVAKPSLSGKISDVDGNAVADAKVMLRTTEYINTKTDANGAYAFENVPPGEYQIKIESKACVTIKDYRKFPKVVIAEGESLTRDFELPRACQIDVRAVDKKGNAIRGVQIFVGMMGNDSFDNRHDTERTDAGGRAIVGGLAPSNGKYLLAAQHPHFAFERTVLQLSDPDKIAKHEFVMRVGETIEGTAICSDGQPPAGWKILAMPEWWRFPQSPVGKRVGEDGSFELQHIVDGKYNVTISVPSGDGGGSSPKTVAAAAELNKMKRPLTLKMDYPSPASMHFLEARVRWLGQPSETGFWVHARSRDGKYHPSVYVQAGLSEFKLGPTPAAVYDLHINDSEIEVINTGKIKNLPGLQGVTVPAEKRLQIALRRKGQPIVRAVVVDAKTKKPISKLRCRWISDESWMQLVSQGGAVEVDAPRPGRHNRLAVIADGYAMTISDEIYSETEDDLSMTIELGRGASLTGTVMDPSGSPVDGAIVIPTKLAASVPESMARFVSDLDAVKTVDGKFRFEHLPLGEQSFRILHRDFTRADVSSVEIRDKNEPLQITLDSGASVHGQVFDEDGKPAAEVALCFSTNNSSSEEYRLATAVTDQDGKYSVDRIPCRACFVTLGDRYKTTGMVVNVVLPRRDHDNVLNLGGTTKLSGKLLVNGKPFANQRLHLGRPYLGPMGMITETDDRGAFAFHGPPPGQWSLNCKLTPGLNFDSAIRMVTVLPGEDMDMGDIKIQAGTLQFRLTSNGKTITPQYSTTDASSRNSTGRFQRWTCG